MGRNPKPIRTRRTAKDTELAAYVGAAIEALDRAYELAKEIHEAHPETDDEKLARAIWRAHEEVFHKLYASCAIYDWGYERCEERTRAQEQRMKRIRIALDDVRAVIREHADIEGEPV